MKLSQIGERALLKKIGLWCRSGNPTSKTGEITGLGDDCYVARLATKAPLLVTTDTLMEGTHFNLRWLERSLPKYLVWMSLGEKALAVNLSDLASMGRVTPEMAFVTLGLSGDISVDSVDNLYIGMTRLAKTYGFAIVGGDLVRSKKAIISVTLLGQMAKGCQPLTRSGAKEGELLCLSGPVGHSSLGLKLLKRGIGSHPSPPIRRLVQSHISPLPRLKEGALLGNNMATSCLDTSDDLLTSLDILSEESSVGLEVKLDSSHLTSTLLQGARSISKNPLKLFLHGGEDYQLLFTCPKLKWTEVYTKIPSALKIGCVKPKNYGIKIFWQGAPYPAKKLGFEHFK